MLGIISCQKRSLIVLTYGGIHFNLNHSLHSHIVFLLQLITIASELQRFDLDSRGILNQVMTCTNNRVNMLEKYGQFSIVIINLFPSDKGS